MKYFFLLFVLNLQSQSFCSKVTYSVTSKKWDINFKRDNFFDEIESFDKYIFFDLVFNTNESNFQYSGNMGIKEEAFLKDYANFISNGSYYFNGDTIFKKQLFKNKAFNVYYISNDQNWVLKDDVKQIGIYKCFKAIKEVLIKRKSGDIKMNVIAWYCPDIPARFGPKDYHGLPGLIIELEDTHHVFYAEKIYLNQVNCIIENYKKNSISDNEYQKIISSF